MLWPLGYQEGQIIQTIMAFRTCDRFIYTMDECLDPDDMLSWVHAKKCVEWENDVKRTKHTLEGDANALLLFGVC